MPKYSAPAVPSTLIDSDGLIRYRCPSCNRRLAMNAELAGKRSRCPCGIQVRVPIPDSMDSPIIASVLVPAPTPVDLANESLLASQTMGGLSIDAELLGDNSAANAAIPISEPFQPLADAPLLTSEPFSDDPLLAGEPLLASEPIFDDPFAIRDPYSGSPSPIENPPELLDAMLVDDPFSNGTNDIPNAPFKGTPPPIASDPFAAFPTAQDNGFMTATSGATVSNAAPQYRRAPNASSKRVVVHHEIREKKETSLEALGQIGIGIAMMIGAVVWFFAALAYADTIFFYPPFLFVAGLGTFLRGCWCLFDN